MASLRPFCVNFVLGLVCLVVFFNVPALLSLPLDGREQIIANENNLYQSIHKAGKRGAAGKRSPHSLNVKRGINRKRCSFGYPYDCPLRFPGPDLNWPNPWGWIPGPMFPEYGPCPGWGPLWCGQSGDWGPWRWPGCFGGCNRGGWCCKLFLRNSETQTFRYVDLN